MVTAVTRGRDDIGAALTLAAEVEHALLCIYLNCAMSLRRDLGDGIDEVTQVATLDVERELLLIARQEMRHLASVWEVQVKLGFVPRPEHAPFTVAARTALGRRWHWDLRLAPLDLAAAARLLEFELTSTAGPQPNGGIGDFYRALIAAVADALAVGELTIAPAAAVFAGGWSRHASVREVTSADDVVRTLTTIVADSEHGELSHAARMKTIVSRLGNWSGDIARRVAPVAGNASGSLAERVADLGDEAYSIVITSMVGLLETSEPQRERERYVARRAMSGVLRPLYEVLTTLPHGDGAAGPAFELRSSNDQTLVERTMALAARARRVAQDGGPARLAEIAITTRQWADRLAELATPRQQA